MYVYAIFVDDFSKIPLFTYEMSITVAKIIRDSERCPKTAD